MFVKPCHRIFRKCPPHPENGVHPKNSRYTHIMGNSGTITGITIVWPCSKMYLLVILWWRLFSKRYYYVSFIVYLPIKRTCEMEE